jgi:hypothetical protein
MIYLFVHFFSATPGFAHLKTTLGFGNFLLCFFKKHVRFLNFLSTFSSSVAFSNATGTVRHCKCGRNTIAIEREDEHQRRRRVLRLLSFVGWPGNLSNAIVIC